MKVKKLLAIVLSVAMLLSCVNISVFAEPDTVAVEAAEEELQADDAAEMLDIEVLPEEEELQIEDELPENEAELLADPVYLYVNCDYNSSTEGWGTTHFGSYASAYSYATAKARTSTIVIEKTTTISGNCFDNNHENYGRIAVVVKDGAVVGNAISKWDMTYPVTLEAGAKLQSGRPASAGYGNSHIKNTLTIGEAGSEEQAVVVFTDTAYKDMSIAILYNGRMVANNALINVGDLGFTGSATINDSTINVKGVAAFGKNNYYKQTMTNSTMTVKGHNQMNENTYYSTQGTILNQLTMDNSTITVDDGGDGTTAENVTIKQLIMNGGSNVTVEVDTPVSIDGDFKLQDASTLAAGDITITSKGKLTVNPTTTISFESITNNGNIVIEESDGGIFQIFNYTGTGTMTADDYKAIIGEDNYNNLGLTVIDNDLYYADYSTLFVNEAWAGKAAGDVVGSGMIFGTNAFATLQDAAAYIKTDGSDTTIKLLSDVTVNRSVQFNYGTGDVIFTADTPVTVKQTKVSDLDFTKSADMNIVIGENVTFEVYDNASGFYVYYGPSLNVRGAITGGQNWGVLYAFNGNHMVTESGKIGTGRTQIGFAEFTVKGEMDTNYLLVESSTFIADGATVDANVIYDNNNGGQRWGKSDFIIKNGANVKTGALNLSYEDTKLTIDLSSSLEATAINGAGTIVIDAATYTEGAACPISGDVSAFTGKIEVVNEPAYQLVASTDANGNIVLVKAVASVENTNGDITSYATFKEAVAAAGNGDIVTIHENITIDATIALNKNITIKGDGTNKITTASGFSGAVFAVTGSTVNVPYTPAVVTFDSLVFENCTASNLISSTWATPTVRNCVFNNNTTSSAMLYGHSMGLYVYDSTFTGNTANSGALVMTGGAGHYTDLTVDGCIFENNVSKGHGIVRTVQGSVGNHNAATGKTDADCVISNTKFIGNKNETADQNVGTVYLSYTTDVYNCLFKNNTTITGSATRKNGGAIVTGGESTGSHIYDNAFINNTAIGGINATLFVDAPMTVGANYYNDTKMPNVSTESGEDVDVYISEDGETRVLYWYTAYDEATGTLSGLAVPTDTISITLEKVDVDASGNDTAEDDDLYNIVLTASDVDYINRLNSVDLTFNLAQPSGANVYEIIAFNTEVAINNVAGNRYEFHYEGKTGTTTDTDNAIIIGQAKVKGYGTYTFAVADADTNVVHATKLFDNIVDTFKPNPAAGEGTLNDDASVTATINAPTRKLTVNIDFNNAVAMNPTDYQNMMIEVTGGDLDKPITVALGNDTRTVEQNYAEKAGANYIITKAENNQYVVEFNKVLTKDIAYNVTVSGDGYRTARYTVTMTDAKTLNFWNNVMDVAQVVETNKAESATKLNFLAGDVLEDNKINIYDLSAVVSYFGQTGTAANGYAQYDLNRDTKIDSKDVAYVLVSWNN